MKIALGVVIFIVIFPAIHCILNGSRTSYGQFPYMAGFMIKRYDLLNCGGAIITSRLIITTAHCICNRWSYEYYYVLVGTIDLKEGGIMYELIQSICHENFIPEKKSNDIGMVKTKVRMEFDYSVQMIALQLDDIPTGKQVIATGWGCLVQNSEKFPRSLRYGVLTYLGREECSSIYWGSYDYNFICTGTSSDVGLCKGDSGSPATYNSRLAGISYAQSDSGPDLFINVADYVHWIYRMIYVHNRDDHDRILQENIEYNYSYNYNKKYKLADAWKLFKHREQLLEMNVNLSMVKNFPMAKMLAIAKNLSIAKNLVEVKLFV